MKSVGVQGVRVLKEDEGWPEAEFLDVFGTKILRVFLLAIHSHLYYGFYHPPPLEQNWFVM